MERDFTHQFSIDGIELTASVSPCVWMYPNYPLQVCIDMSGGGRAFLQRKDRNWESTTEADVIGLAESIRLKPCSRCGKPAYDPDVVDTNRAGLCEHCFMTDLNAEFEKEQKKEAAKVRRQDARMKKKGFTHRVTAWVHPARGSDYQVDLYFNQPPSKAMIAAELKKAGSVVLDDHAPPVVI